MSNTLQAVHLLKDTLETLLSNYEVMKRKNEELLVNNNKLQRLLEKKEKQVADLDSEIKMLKVVKTIESSSESVRDTKLKINALIREIDKCIIQLNS